MDKNTVAKGESCQITITCETGYYLDSLKINGVDKTGEVVDGKYTIANVSVTTKIDVKFVCGVMYVSQANAPVLDGEIDAVWDTAPKMTIKNVYSDNGQYTESNFAWAKVLWTETGFYYLGYVYDKTTCAIDRLNIWVAETYVYAQSTNEQAIPYSQTASDGNYAICINPQGENLYYTGIDITQHWDEDTTAKVTEDGYIVEIFVPCLSVQTLTEGREIGLDFSVDYFHDTASERDACNNWYGGGWYWSNVGALRKLTLVK